ncbi:MAG TPA: ABC transporter ATP-binding protein [Candidatus Dormibacteraeota bacterium]|nr:ABC transporter ATP-binding protein [Candidatus Dormibacteraeota bacterium]
MNPHLQISNLTKRFGRTCALDNVCLRVERGTVLALLGPNGAGKSTLFGCLLGLTRPTRGDILLDGGVITDAARSRFGYVAERVALYWHRTVRDNAELFARFKGCAPSCALQQLTRVGLDSVTQRPVCQLSKGMLQRLGLAIALCGEPELLILDEPFNGLDPALLDTFQGVLREEIERGATLLISTHTISAVEPLASDVAVLLEGRLAAHGSVSELTARYPEEASLEAVYRRIARGEELEALAA